MARSSTITVIDIGTSYIKALQVASGEDSAQAGVLAAAVEPSEGVRRGVVSDVNATGRRVKNVLDKIQQMSHAKINGVFANINGSHLFTVSSHGGVAVSRADQKISMEDVNRVLSAAQAMSLPPNKEILEVWPKEYVVDQEKDVKEPIGMRGVRLEVEVLALCGFSPYVKNISDAIVSSGFASLDLVPTPLAVAKAVLTPKQKELGCAVLDIGARTTNLAVFEEGQLIYAAVFPVGSANITDDIAIGLRIDIDVAEKIKTDFGLSYSGSRTKIKVPKNKKMAKAIIEDELYGEPPVDFRHIPQKALRKIIELRLYDIFDEVNKDLKKISRQGFLPAGVVLTGGGAKLPNIIELSKKDLKLPCQIGLPRGLRGLPADPSFSAACGMVLDVFDSGELHMNADGLGKKIRSWFKMFMP